MYQKHVLCGRWCAGTWPAGPSTSTRPKRGLFSAARKNLVSVADPDPKDLQNYAGSGSNLFSMDPIPWGKISYHKKC